MKKHTSSRSRSRSHSPFSNREKKYPRGYQNSSREFRGYHRGFRRPYNFRGRGRGQFPRGRYQRGGGGYNYYNNNNNNNYRPNWKNYKQHPQKQQQQKRQQPQPHQRQYNSSQGQSQNLRKCSESPTQGHSHRSDRSSSPLSRLSQHSCSSSHSSSPKCRPASVLANPASKNVIEDQVASAEVQKGGRGDEEPTEPVDLLAGSEREGSGGGKTEGSWHDLSDCSSTPKKSSPLASAVTAGQSSQSTSQANPAKLPNDASNGAPMWQMAASKKPSHEGLNPMLSSFDFFSPEECLDGDKKAISIAFRKFLEEENKKSNPAWENAMSTDANDVDVEKGKVNGKASAAASDLRKHREESEDVVSLKSFLKASPFLSAEEEEEEEVVAKPPSKSLHKGRHNGEETSKPKSKVTHSARKLFEECFAKWQTAAYSQFVNGDLDAVGAEAYFSGKQDKAERSAAALAKKEFTKKLEEPSADMSSKARKMATSPSIPAFTSTVRRSGDRELLTVGGQDTPLMSSRKDKAKFNVKMDFLGDGLTSTLDILAEERQLCQDLVQSSKKNQEFRSIFQHVQAPQSQKSPSELFAQHIVAIVHHVKAQHFPSSGTTLNERFTMYQRQAAEKEMMKPRKSPEIHRRIDVSPSAFKKHPQLFEGMKSSEEGTYKDGGEKAKADPMDLRLDIERRKKFSTYERDYNQERGRAVGESSDFSRERSEEKLSKYGKKSKDKKRSRSSSSSSSSSSKSHKDESSLRGKSEPKDEVADRARPGQREPPAPAEGGWPHGGFQIRISGRSWNKDNFQGNSSHSNPLNVASQPKSADWDPEFTPKSKKYYLHDDRDKEPECKWMDGRGRGRGSLPSGRARFIIRKATGGARMNSPKWALDKFQANGEQGGKEGSGAKQDHKEPEMGGDT
ncbi:thyroid hormone receptor-associated protein 3 isoform X2 [Cololabis saira]|uniref:thyroid hormone receptor-associated protein 3 isoform X2 n=1 Tax=Cololabis saira TaxID=129043 RepID=UPI002AD51085|nr:thyroid hormone receptor-associated protein 3 isoform X2 [Cololabis saira]